MSGVPRLCGRRKPPEGGTPNQVLSRFSSEIIGRLTRSLPQSSPFGLPVCVARVPTAPLSETPILLCEILA